MRHVNRNRFHIIACYSAANLCVVIMCACALVGILYMNKFDTKQRLRRRRYGRNKTHTIQMLNQLKIDCDYKFFSCSATTTKRRRSKTGQTYVHTATNCYRCFVNRNTGAYGNHVLMPITNIFNCGDNALVPIVVLNALHEMCITRNQQQIDLIRLTFVET